MTGQPVAFETSLQQADLLSRPGTPRSQVARVIAAHTTEEAFAAAFAAVVERHEALRTTFRWEIGLAHPLQLIDGGAQPSVTFRFAQSPIARYLRDIGDRAWAQPLEMHKGPLVLVNAVAGTDEILVCITAAAAIADSASLDIILSELANVLGGGDLAEAPLQAAEYAAWQKDALGAQAGAKEGDPDHVEPWRFTTFPVSGPGNSGADLPWRETPIELGAETEILHGLAVRAGGDASDGWLAAWVALASRLTGVTEVVLGVVRSGRAGGEMAAAVGPFQWVLPVPFSFGSDSTLADLITRAAAIRAEMSGRLDVPPGNPTIPDIALCFENLGTERPLLRRDNAILGHFRLQIAVGSEPAATLLSEPGTISDEHARAVGRSLAAIVKSWVARPDAQLDDVVALDSHDAYWLCDEFNAQLSTAESRTFPEMFAAQAERTPERLALADGERGLTYAELDEASDRLASRLGLCGQRPVAIVMDRSVEQIVAVLAVLKTGSPYLCLTTDQPAVRAESQLRHAGATMVVTTRAHRHLIEGTDARVLYFDDPAPDVTPGPVATARPSPSDLAYLIFTSGSSGAPKAVAVSHGNLANYATAIAELVSTVTGVAQPAWRYGLVTTMATDLGNTSVFPALISGGCVDAVPAPVAADPAAFAEYNSQHHLDVLKITPSHLRALFVEGAAVLPSQLLVLGGEVLGWDLVDQINKAADCVVFNHYGPTETTVGALVFDARSPAPVHRARTGVPIGRPLLGTEAYIVDARLRPVAPGEPGELLIAGRGLASGYWRDPQQTAERFIDNPVPGAASRWPKVYRTGDRARHLPDGSVEFLGRLDSQVKIRGYRVEPGEIEACLRGHPLVSQAAVTLDQGAAPNAQLVAYVVCDQRPEASELRDFLRRSLPEHMVPVCFVALGALPLGPNGKIDFRRLPAANDQVETSTLFVEPSTDSEIAVASVFAELLGAERVGATDDFFELGGHSLLATQVVARLRARFNLPLPVHALFTAPTVAGLAGVIDDERLRASEPSNLRQLAEEIAHLSDEEVEALLAGETAEDHSE